MALFNRTSSGQAAKFNFYQKALLWVEGPSDVVFYGAMLGPTDFRIEAAGGKEECLKLVENLLEKDLPFAVAIDGDYDILLRCRNRHRRAVHLRRHSIENYLFELDLLTEVCRDLLCISTISADLDAEFQMLESYLESELLELIELDVASFLQGGNRMLPRRIESILESGDEIIFNVDRTQALLNKSRAAAVGAEKANAKKLLHQFLLTNRFVFILPGHYLFAIQRRLIAAILKRKKHSGPKIGDHELLVLLATKVWKGRLDRDHSKIRRMVVKAVNEAKQLRSCMDSKKIQRTIVAPEENR